MNKILIKTLIVSGFCTFVLTCTNAHAVSSVGEVTPNIGTYRQQIPIKFTATYTNPEGWGQIGNVYLAIGSSPSDLKITMRYSHGSYTSEEHDYKTWHMEDAIQLGYTNGQDEACNGEAFYYDYLNRCHMTSHLWNFYGRFDFSHSEWESHPDSTTMQVSYGLILDNLIGESVNIYLRVVDFDKSTGVTTYDTGWVQKGTIRTPWHDPENLELTVSNNTFETYPEEFIVFDGTCQMFEEELPVYASDIECETEQSYLAIGDKPIMIAHRSMDDGVNLYKVSKNWFNSSEYFMFDQNKNANCTVLSREDRLVKFRWRVGAEGGWVGPKNVYLKWGDRGGGESLWKKVVTWTMKNVAPSAPERRSVSEISRVRPGVKILFDEILYSDKNGRDDLAECHFILESKDDSNNKFQAFYEPKTNKLWVIEDDGSMIGGYEPGSANVINSSKGSLFCAETVLTNPAALDKKKWAYQGIKFSLSFSKKFAGEKNIVVKAVDAAGLSSPLVNIGTYEIVNRTPKPTEIMPVRIRMVPGVITTFTTVYRDEDGYDDLKFMHFIVYDPADMNNSFDVYYDRENNKFFLNGETEGAEPESNQTLENDKGILYCISSKVYPGLSSLGNSKDPVYGMTEIQANYVVVWSVSLKDAFVGKRNIKLKAVDFSDASSEFEAGALTVSTPPTLGNVSPAWSLSKPDEVNVLTANYGNASDVQIMIQVPGDNTSPFYDFSNRFYALYVKNENKLYVRLDNGTWSGGYAPGSSNVIETSKGRLHCSSTKVTSSGTEQTVEWGLSIKPSWKGQRVVCIFGANGQGISSGYLSRAEWVIGSAPVMESLVIDPNVRSSRVGQWVTFKTRYSDCDGALDMSACILQVSNHALDNNNCFSAAYYPSEGKFYMAANMPGHDEPLVPVNNIYENSFARLDMTYTKATKVNANTLEIEWRVSFKDPFVGQRTIFTSVYDKSYLGLLQLMSKGSWMIIANRLSEPRLVSTIPVASGSVSGCFVTFRATYTDPDGVSDMRRCYFLANSSSTQNGIQCYYDVSTSELHMLDETGINYVTPSGGICETTYGKFDVSNTKVTKLDANTIEVQWRVCFNESFLGTKDIYLAVTDSANFEETQWIPQMKWHVQKNLAPSALDVSLVPFANEMKINKWVTFSSTYTDPNGISDISSCGFRINTVSTSGSNCFDAYYVPGGTFHLRSDAGQGDAESINGIYENTYVKLDASSSDVIRVDANTIKVQWRVYFKEAFLGAKKLYISCSDMNNSGNGLWFNKGELKVVSNSVPQNVSVSSVPAAVSTKMNKWVTFKTTYYDADGTEDLAKCALRINTKPNGNYAGFEAYVDGAGNISMLGTGPDDIVVPSNNMCSNSYAILDLSHTKVYQTDRNTLTVIWRIKFLPSMVGKKFIYMQALDKDGAGNNLSIYKGPWTIENASPSNAPVLLKVECEKSNVLPGTTTMISAYYYDEDGADDISDCFMTITSEAAPIFRCKYDMLGNTLGIQSYEGGPYETAELGSNSVIALDIGSIDCSKTTFEYLDNKTILIKWAVSFSEYMLGVQDISLIAFDYESKISESGVLSQINVTNDISTSAPRVINIASDSTAPYLLPGEFVTFTVTVADDDGLDDIGTFGLSVNFAGTDSGLVVMYDRSNDSIVLRSEGNMQTVISNQASAGSPKYINDLYATIDCENTFAWSGGESLSMMVRLSFREFFAGTKNIEAFVSDSSERQELKYSDIKILTVPVFADIDSDGSDELAIDKSVNKGVVIVKNGTDNYSVLRDLSPDMMIKAAVESGKGDDLVIDFGSGYGIWMRTLNGGWQSIHPLSPENMAACDINGDNLDELIIDFGMYGIYLYFPRNAENSKWEKIHSISPRLMSAGDVDNDGKDEVVIDFGVYGIYILNYGDSAAWTKLHSIASNNIIASDMDGDCYSDITIDFGKFGLWRANLSPYVIAQEKWTFIHYVTPKNIVIGDIDGDGKKDTVVDFRDINSGTDYGIFALDGRSGWSGGAFSTYWNTVHSVPSLSMACGNYDSQNSGDELLIDFGAQYKKWMKYSGSDQTESGLWAYLNIYN